MNQKKFCQSCGMPLDSGLCGTEKDGSRNREYCKYCYEDGKFINPTTTLDEMRSEVMHKMEKSEVPEDIIEATIGRLPYLKRWMPASTVNKKRTRNKNKGIKTQ